MARLVVPVVSAPATAAAVVASSAAIATAAESTVVAVLALLVVVGALVAQTAQTTAILAVPTEVARISTAEALLVRLLRTALARCVLRSRSGTTLLSTQDRWAGAAAFGVTEWLEGVVIGSRLSTGLLTVRAVVRVPLLTSE